MFTGIIENLGTVVNIIKTPGKTVLSVQCDDGFKHTKVNDSISINGCCLTVVNLHNNCADFDILPETLSRTNLHLLVKGSVVNVEPSISMQSKLGGHIIQGHVDCTATISDITSSGDSNIFTLTLPQSFLRMLVPKAFISVDGISLTITEVTANHFSVMIIPHTQNITVAKYWEIDNLVNIEVDIINKSIFHYLTNVDFSKCKLQDRE